jgi:ataxin-3
MPIVGISDFASASDGDGASGEKLPPYGPGGIYHEKQVAAMCAVHCVNNMLQGPMFEYSDFGRVAQELDAAERRLTGGAGLDYGNMRMDGFFNVQVMQTVLTRAGYQMQALAGEAGKTAQGDTAKESAFILNKREHWFALRRIGREWFDLNSCMRTPRHYTDSDVRFHISDAVKEGYMVFVVRGNFPRSALEEDPQKLVEAIQGCGRPGQGYSLFAGSGNRLGAPAVGNDISAPVSKPSNDALRRARLARFGGASNETTMPEPVAVPSPSTTAAPSTTAPVAVPAPMVDDPMFNNLVAMGFEAAKVRRAMEASAGNYDVATEILLAY